MVYADSVKEFRHPDFLLLRCQINMSPTEVTYEPLVGPNPERTGSPSDETRLSGTVAALLEQCIRSESTKLWGHTEAETAMDELSLSPKEYRQAAEELADLGLVDIHWNGNSVSGIARVSLEPSAYLEVAPQLDLGIDVAGEVGKILVFASRVDSDNRFRTVDLLKFVNIPLARLDLTLRALENCSHLVGHGPGSPAWGSSMEYSVTPSGRRLIRGEDSLF